MSRRELLITWIVVLPVLFLLALRPAAAQAGWSGWARCEFNIQGPGYQNRETHTWFVSNAIGNTSTTWGPGNWSVSGSGRLNTGNPSTSAQDAEWAINGGPIPDGRFAVLTANGMVSIRPVHSQMGQTNGIAGYTVWTANNNQRPPTPISATAYEWAFPTVQGPDTSQTLSGSGPGVPAPGWGYLRATGSTMTVSCTWSFANGALPAPPPPIAATPIPVPPRTAPEYPWTGSIECLVSVTASDYQDQQLHTWTLTGGQPSLSGSVYLHPAIWRVKGNGGFQQTVGRRSTTASWQTTAQDKAPFAMYIRASDKKLIVGPSQPPRRATGGIHGSLQITHNGIQQAPTPITLDAVEWVFPLIEEDRTAAGFKGQSSPQVTAAVAPMQPTGATVSCNCSWRLHRGP